jgi:hypothetical protein
VEVRHADVVQQVGDVVGLEDAAGVDFVNQFRSKLTKKLLPRLDTIKNKSHPMYMYPGGLRSHYPYLRK